MVTMSGQQRKKRQASDSFRLGGLLAVIGGFLDAYTFLGRGGVFANAQTGNIVLLGISAAKGQWTAALLFLIPISAFIAGVLLAERVKLRYQQRGDSSFHWRQIIVVFEAAVLTAVAFIPQGRWNIAVNIAVSFVCALQVETFRKIHGDTFATTMCTGNLRSATELFYRFRMQHDGYLGRRSLRYYGVILFFILGAAIGTFLTDLWPERSVLFCLIPFGAAYLLMRRRDFSQTTE